MGGTLDDLDRLLQGLDGRGYPAYKRAKGAWSGEDFTLYIDHVQGDPFATPSKLTLHLPPASHGIPDEAWGTDPRRVGLCDFLLRAFKRACESVTRVGGSGKSGLVLVSVDSPIVVERAGCSIDPDGLTLRFRVGLPAAGRRCLGRSAAELLTRHLPQAFETVRWMNVDQDLAWRWVRTTEDHDHLQRQLAGHGLIAFVRDGSILPRRSGVSSDPLPDALPFESAPELRVRLATVHQGEVEGMGIPAGVTVVTGGGFHGKTTLLEALQFGVFPHIPGDGREWTVTVADAAKVRSEDGRSVAGVDLRPFIHDLPLERDTGSFHTEDASGSTSLAADIMEALEAGTSLLLMDEDTCATNLLVRDARMQELVERETITPLIDRVRELHDLGVSLILVTGGGGDYLDVADAVLLMEEYRPRLVTDAARRIAESHPTGRRIGEPNHPIRPTDRVPLARSFDARRRSGKVTIKTRGADTIQFGEQDLDLRALEQLADYGQARAIGAFLAELERSSDGTTPIRVLVRDAVASARSDGLVSIEPSPELAMPRPQDLAKALNRLRSLRVEGRP
jgi:predicted ABC-class ATPase